MLGNLSGALLSSVPMQPRFHTLALGARLTSPTLRLAREPDSFHSGNLEFLSGCFLELDCIVLSFSL